MGDGQGFNRLGSTRTAPDTSKSGLYREGVKASGINDFPGTDEGRFSFDLATITGYDAKTKTLNIRTLRKGSTPAKVEYVSMMFDPQTGNGVYITPKRGMMGLYWEIDGKGFFGPMTAAMERTGGGYSNAREEAPAGSFVARTGRETKFVASPNLLLVQAANFCKVLMKRVNKLIDVLFYSLRLTSLAGSISWATKLSDRTAVFLMKIRDRLPRRQDFLGRLEKADDSVEVELRAGNVTKDIGASFRLSRAEGPGDKISLEADEVRGFRLLVRDLFEKRSISGFKDLLSEQNADVLVSSIGFASAQDSSRDALIEAIVDAASYVARAIPESKNGVKRLAPTEDSVENLESGNISALGKKDPEEINEDQEFLIPANPVENRKITGGSDSVYKEIVEQAREAKSPKEAAKIRTRFRADVKKKDGTLEVTQPEGQTTWTLAKMFQLISKKGPIDLDSGSGMRVLAKDGMFFLGNETAGISIGKDGTITITGKKLRVFTYKDAGGTDEAAQKDPLKKKVRVANKFELTDKTFELKIEGDLNLLATGSINLLPKQKSSATGSTLTVKNIRDGHRVAAGVQGLVDPKKTTEKEQEKAETEKLPDPFADAESSTTKETTPDA